MEPEKLLEYLGYEVEENGRLVVIYKTMDEWERERDTKFHYYYDEQTGILYGDDRIEKVLLPIGRATTLEEAVLLARQHLERLFSDKYYAMRRWKRKNELTFRREKEGGAWRRQQYIRYSPEEEERILREQAKILARQDKKAGKGGEGGD